jgi:flagellar biosynthesis/type III secretory pathway chaperone
MKETLFHLIEALREELKQYGEMLALLDHQQLLVMHRRTSELPENVDSVNAQAGVIAAARKEREQRQRQLARLLDQPDTAGFTILTPMIPADYQPLMEALVGENNSLLIRVQQRARQNHLMLSHCVELMQQLINSIFPGANPATYNDTGHVASAPVTKEPIYQAVG